MTSPGDVDSDLVVLMGPWMDEGACKGEDTRLFFPPKGISTRPAKAICRDCGVRETCLDWALVNEVKSGVWGGTSELERRPMRKAMKAGRQVQMV